MVLHEQTPGKTSSPAVDDTGGSAAGHYTGVVIIHGIGNEKRNETLQEALNALTYWFNHEAGLALRPKGHGRVWLRTRFTEDDDPDAPASQATLEIVPPSSGAAAPEDASTLRLEMREVWWAQSFGLPAAGSALKWARLQFREEAAMVLLPRGTRAGTARAASQTTEREIGQALPSRPSSKGAAFLEPLRADTHEPSPTTGATLSHRIKLASLHAGLWVYSVIQYAWKLVQWIVLTRLIYLLLLVMGLIRLLALIPLSFVESSIVKGLSAIVRGLTLHWIAPLQVYLVDYARASSIRQLFEREINGFLRDERCDHIVVIAHSMGTVISYEGLTTALAQADAQAIQKPITYICLAQALRRMWLLARTDPHRLRGVLPESVRWLHFWARYDPVAVGPLRSTSLPRLAKWPDPEQPDPYDALCATLEHCDNREVVNTDSLFTDHTTYWRNVEQVVGPIARELVAGHPALAEVVQAHLATAEDVLRRRWRVAWRNMLALVGGAAVGCVLLLWDYQNGWPVGHSVIDFFVNGTFGNVANAALALVCPSCSAVGSSLHISIPGPKGLPSFSTAGFGPPRQVADAVAATLAALIAMAISVPVLGAAVAMPSPFTFHSELDPDEDAPRLFRASVAAILAPLAVLVAGGILAAIAAAVTGSAVPGGILVVVVGLTTLLIPLTWVRSAVDAAKRRRWGWVAALVPSALLALLAIVYGITAAFAASPSSTGQPFVAYFVLLDGFFNFLHLHVYANVPADIVIIGGLLATVGSLLLIIGSWRTHQRRRSVAVASVTLILLAVVVGVFFVPPDVDSGYVIPAAILTTYIYGLRAGPLRLASSGAQDAAVRSILALSSGSLLCLFHDHALICSAVTYSQCFVTNPISPLAILGGLMAAAAALVAVFNIIWQRRWAWFLVAGLTATATLYVWDARESTMLSYYLANMVQLQPVNYGTILYHGVWLAILMVAVSYGLFGSLLAPVPKLAPGQRSARTIRRLVVSGIFAVLLTGLVWVAPPVPTNPQLDQLARAPTRPLAAFLLPVEFRADALGNIIAGPDGNLWFSGSGSGTEIVGRITLAGAITVYSVGKGDFSLSGIASGLDGNLWFTEGDADEIGRITPQGVLTTFPLPHPNSGPDDITLGPDGNLWFAEDYAHKIGRITPQGVITEFPLPHADSSAGGMTSGPDGNVWFIDRSLIGRITPNGIITESRVPSTSASGLLFLDDLTFGPDGNLWFITGDAKVGRITPVGSVTVFSPPSSASGNFGSNEITDGPDENLWFTEDFANAVGRITPAGVVTEFRLLQPNSQPESIVAGPDGNLWFLENASDSSRDAIGRITP